MKAEEILKNLYENCSNGNEWDWTLERVKQYANQRVIEELEEIKIRLSKKSFSEHCVEEVDNRIKELKQ